MPTELLPLDERLDERTFDELIVETQARITRYSAGEWTDFNDSDPGMTIVQLFAWLTEMTIFRLNQVPDRTLLKLLETLHFRPLPAQPATARLTFVPFPDANVDAPRSLPQRARVEADNPAGGEPIVFETKVGIDVAARKLNAIQVFNGAGFEAISQDLGQAGLETMPAFFPFTWNPDTNVALYLGFSPSIAEQAQFDEGLADLQQRIPTSQLEDFLVSRENVPRSGIFPARLVLYANRPPPDQASPRIARECDKTVEPATTRARVRWEYRRTRADGRWQALRTLRDETNGFQKDGYIEIERPGEIALDSIGLIEEPHFWIRCRLESGDGLRDDPPRVALLLPNTVDAVNLETFEDEFLGVSEGVPDQEFELGQQAVSFEEGVELRLEYDDGHIETDWELRKDFLCSTGESRHFLLDPAAGKIHFGDGQRGQIPLAATRIIAVRYRRSAGEAGNLPPRSIKTLAADATFVESVTNHRPAAGGRDVQSTEDFVRDAPGRLKRQDRAVTAEDYQELALESGSIADAKALALHHPDYPGVPVPGAITVVIVPATRAVPPVASPEQLSSVRCYLEERRVIGTELFVVAARPVPLDLRLGIESNRMVSFEQLSENVRKELKRKFNPLDVDEIEQPKPSLLGIKFYRNKVLDLVLDIEGVANAVIHEIKLPGKEVEKDKPRKLADDELLYLRSLEIVPLIEKEGAAS